MNVILFPPSPQAMEAELHLGKASVSVKCMWKEKAQSPGKAGGKGAGITLLTTEEHKVYEIWPVQVAYI